MEKFKFITKIKDKSDEYNLTVWIYCGPKCRILQMYKDNTRHVFNCKQTTEFINKYLALRKAFY